MKQKFEIGLYTLGELYDEKGGLRAPEDRINDIIEIAKIADEAGLDVYAVGEHHREDFVSSSHTTLLAAIAAVTKNIKLSSAVSVIGTTDPVRLYEDFATIDLISKGRAELILGRGAFIESFGLFGYDINDYDALFQEKVELFLKLKENKIITWKGQFRAPLNHAAIYPRAMSNLPVWIGVGGTPESAVRAGKLGVNMSMGLLSGSADRMTYLTDLYYDAAQKAGHDISKLRVAVSSHGYVGKTNTEAIDEFYPHYKAYLTTLLKERGMNFRTSKMDMERQLSSDEILAIGDPKTVANKILYQHKIFGHTRFLAQIDVAGQSLERVKKVIDLLANEVSPLVNNALKDGVDHV